MAGNAASLVAGFDYQFLYGWWRVLGLLLPAGEVESVTIEDPEGKHFDDVTIRPRTGTGHPAEYLQVKFHVEQSRLASSAWLEELDLVRKAWKTWLALRDEFPLIELTLVTTWPWDPDDIVRIGDQRLVRDFVAGTMTHLDARRTREAWRNLVGEPEESEFQDFLRALRLRTGFDEKTELIKHVRERMGWLGLRTDDDALRAGSSQVVQWVLDHHGRVTRAELESAIEDLKLRVEPSEPSVALYVHTIRKMPVETGASYELDWRDAFEGTDRERGHQLLDPGDWNGRLLPELEATASRIEQETDARLLRVRGLSRLSPWFAVGYTFRQTTGWAVETDQYGVQWRTDSESSVEPCLISVEDLAGRPDTVVVSVGVTGDPTDHVRHYLAQAGDPAGKLIVVRTPRQGKEAITCAGDLVRLSLDVKGELQKLVPHAKCVLLFYWGPASGAVFIGHHLNAVAGEIQLHEEQGGEYIPSITLV
jgi:hypothetical protein